MDLGPTLKERLVLQEQRKEQSPSQDPDWLDFDKVADKFDKIDHLIDLHGHIVGMGLSPDHRFVSRFRLLWIHAHMETFQVPLREQQILA